MIFIVYDSFEEKYLGYFDSRKDATSFIDEYVSRTGYDDSDIGIIEVVHNPDIKDVVTTKEYSITVRKYIEDTYTIEADNEEEARALAEKMFDYGLNYEIISVEEV